MLLKKTHNGTKYKICFPVCAYREHFRYKNFLQLLLLHKIIKRCRQRIIIVIYKIRNEIRSNINNNPEIITSHGRMKRSGERKI